MKTNETMKNLLVFLILIFSSCQFSDKYDWEKNREEVLDTKDLVLIYAGGAHRNIKWDKTHLTPYVTYTDEAGKEHWLFDGFLFLEIHNGQGKSFAAGYTDTPANREDWVKLVDYYFQSEIALGALDKTVGEAILRIGEPAEKRRVVIALPEPISYPQNQNYWGVVKKNELLDFSKSEDRVLACRWYIDYVREQFNKQNFKNIELSGFYWLAEKATGSRAILGEVASYLNKLKYSFNWIPYFNSDGVSEWKTLGFNYAFKQPNYFFADNIPYERLNIACDIAKKYGMDMELEFDAKVLEGAGSAYKLRDYMKAFRENGVWEKSRLAYYEGGGALYYLSVSSSELDAELYREFCEFVIKRPVR